MEATCKKNYLGNNRNISLRQIELQISFLGICKSGGILQLKKLRFRFFRFFFIITVFAIPSGILSINVHRCRIFSRLLFLFSSSGDNIVVSALESSMASSGNDDEEGENVLVEMLSTKMLGKQTNDTKYWIALSIADRCIPT